MFISEYLVDMNASRAAKSAGYSLRTAYSQGQRLLKNVEIAAAIETGLKAQAEKADVSAERVLRAIAAIAFDDSPEKSESTKLRALELLGKHLELFSDKVEVRGSSDEVQLILLPDNGFSADGPNKKHHLD